MNDDHNDIEFKINNELNRLKEEEKLLKDALFLKTRKYIFNNLKTVKLKNNVEVINHNNSTILQSSNNNSNRLENISYGLKYFDNIDINMHQCHLCTPSYIQNDQNQILVII